jgi:hypothetical protein
MNKFQRILWTVNGILLLIALLFIGGVAVKEFSSWFFRHYDEPEIIVGKDLEEAKQKGLVLQGLDYSDPIAIYGTKNFLLPVSIKTYETPQSSNLKDSYSLGEERIANYYNTVNIIFLNADLTVSQALLDKKGFIQSFKYPSDEDVYEDEYTAEKLDHSIKNITYMISLEDSNDDGTISDEDDADLYISDLDGKNLKRITQDINVDGYNFIDSNTILISWFKREKIPAEHQKKYFKRYLIKEDKLEDLASLHNKLDEIERLIIK